MVKPLTLSLFFIALVVMAALALQPGSAHGPPPPSLIQVPPGGVSFPMQDYGGRPVIDVLINEKGPYPFILDTGASITVIGEEINRELSLPSSAGVSAHSLASGSPPPIVTVQALRAGDAVIGGFIAAILPLAAYFKDPKAPRGILSASSFPGCLVIFDYPGKRIFIRNGSLGAPDARTVFEYSQDQDLPAVPIRIAGHETQIHLDTGSAFTLTLPRKFLAELPLKSKPQDSGVARTLGGTYPVSTAAVDGQLEIGKYQLEIPEVRFSDVRPGAKIGPGNIGCAVLKDFVVTLDSKNRRIRMER